jgi:putative ABC transport system substrate-binding protein
MINNTRVSRRLLHAVVASLAVLPLAALAAAQPSPTPKWFRYAANIEETWKVSEAAAGPMQFEIQRKKKDSGASSQRILVLYPRASSAYDIAISKILQVLDSKDVDANVTVINFKMQDEAGTAAIRFAEQNKYDLIFAMGSESTAWLFDHYRGGKIPVVSVCSKDPVQLGQIADYERGSGTNFAFTSLNVPVDVQMAYVNELRPDL